jgi:hypothetical protein
MGDQDDDSHGATSSPRERRDCEYTPRPRDDRNPFVSFKEFIDNSIDTLAWSLKDSFDQDQSDDILEVQKEWERHFREDQDVWTRWTGSAHPHDFNVEFAQRTIGDECEVQNATFALLSEAQKKNAHVPVEKIKALFADEEASGSAPLWLSVDWFKRDAYSPIQLEAHPDLAQEGSKWRAAFEDLMHASLDKPMTSSECVGMRQPFGKPQSTYYGPGLDWLLSLQCRGILPPLMPRSCNSLTLARTIQSKPMRDIITGVDSSDPRPWKNGGVTRPSGFSFLMADLVDLSSQVGIKATTQTEAEPLAEAPRPATEQDLYDSPHLYPVNTAAKERTGIDTRPQQRLDARIPVSPIERGSMPTQDDRLDELKQHLWDALDTGDSGRAVELIEAWRNGRELVDRGSRGHLKESRASGESMSDEDAMSSETTKRRNLAARHLELTGTPLRLSPSTPLKDFEELVERLAQEHESLEQTFGASEQPSAAKQNAPGVLSALTTTQTIRSPDGTVTTKVVLKQRFSDGREETSESVHTTNDAVDPAKEEPKPKGWFWS